MPRPAPHRLRAALLVATLLAVASGNALATWTHDAGTNLSLTPSTNNQSWPAAVSDGAGGMIVVWTEQVGVQLDLRAQRVTSAGAIAPGWPAAGMVVCTGPGDRRVPVAVSDGAGGAIVAWQDNRAGVSNNDIFAQHIQGNATLAPGWPSAGLNLSITLESKDEAAPQLASDGAGGALVVWTLFFSGSDYDIYGAHVSGAGSVVWSTSVYAPGGLQEHPRVVPDGSGGMLIAFDDQLSGDFDPKAMRVTGSNVTLWGPTALVVETGDQDGVQLVGDGAGGAYYAWTDVANSPIRVAMTHLTSNGAHGPGQFAGTVGLAQSVFSQQDTPLLTTDAAGGCYVVWEDQRYGGDAPFVQRIGPNGFVAPGWPDGGIELASAALGTTYGVAIPDGAGGVLFASPGSGYLQVVGSRVTSGGLLQSGWPSSGAVLAASGAAGGFITPAVADGSGGAMVAFVMTRSGSGHMYAQNVDGFGALGDARPALTKIADVPNDQGGSVSLQWTASYLDALPARTVYQYSIWRRVPGGVPALAAARARAAHTGRALRAGLEGDAVVYWEYLETQPARAFAGYSAVVATPSDSLPSGNPRTSFMVQAEETGGVPYWSSAPDSGYSVDNIPPVPPAPFTAAYAAGATHLHWGANAEADLAGYRLYRGASSGFVPSSVNRIADQPDTGYIDPGAAGAWYKLSAVDIHGNESVFAVLSPSQTTAAPAPAPRALAFAPSWPEPAPGAVQLAFTLPRDARIALAVLDAAGRRVDVLLDAVAAAGEHRLNWSGRDAAGTALHGGVYYAELCVEGRRLVRRITLLR